MTSSDDAASAARSAARVEAPRWGSMKTYATKSRSLFTLTVKEYNDEFPELGAAHAEYLLWMQKRRREIEDAPAEVENIASLARLAIGESDLDSCVRQWMLLADVVGVLSVSLFRVQTSSFVDADVPAESFRVRHEDVPASASIDEINRSRSKISPAMDAPASCKEGGEEWEMFEALKVAWHAAQNTLTMMELDCAPIPSKFLQCPSQLSRVHSLIMNKVVKHRMLRACTHSNAEQWIAGVHWSSDCDYCGCNFCVNFVSIPSSMLDGLKAPPPPPAAPVAPAASVAPSFAAAISAAIASRSAAAAAATAAMVARSSATAAAAAAREAAARKAATTRASSAALASAGPATTWASSAALASAGPATTRASSAALASAGPAQARGGPGAPSGFVPSLRTRMEKRKNPDEERLCALQYASDKASTVWDIVAKRRRVELTDEQTESFGTVMNMLQYFRDRERAMQECGGVGNREMHVVLCLIESKEMVESLVRCCMATIARLASEKDLDVMANVGYMGMELVNSAQYYVNLYGGAFHDFYRDIALKQTGAVAAATAAAAAGGFGGAGGAGGTGGFGGAGGYGGAGGAGSKRKHCNLIDPLFYARRALNYRITISNPTTNNLSHVSGLFNCWSGVNFTDADIGNMIRDVQADKVDDVMGMSVRATASAAKDVLNLLVVRGSDGLLTTPLSARINMQVLVPPYASNAAPKAAAAAPKPAAAAPKPAAATPRHKLPLQNAAAAAAAATAASQLISPLTLLSNVATSMMVLAPSLPPGMPPPAPVAPQVPRGGGAGLRVPQPLPQATLALMTAAQHTAAAARAVVVKKEKADGDE